MKQGTLDHPKETELTKDEQEHLENVIAQDDILDARRRRRMEAE